MARKYKAPSRQSSPSSASQNQPAVERQSTSLKIRIDDLTTLKPLSENQKHFFEAYDSDEDYIITHGYAGTGKSFLAVYKALEEVLDPFNKMDKVIIVRSAVQGRDIGHLPGDTEEKMDVFAQPYKQICANLFNRKDAWSRLVEQGKIVFESTSFLRGCTFDKSVIIVDEVQNLSWPEILAIVTRAGKDTRLIFCGDFRQTDLDKKKSDLSGIHKFLEVSKKMKGCTLIEYGIDDICRSAMVKDFIIAVARYEENEL